MRRDKTNRSRLYARPWLPAWRGGLVRGGRSRMATTATLSPVAGRHLLGLGMLLLAIVPAYVISRPDTQAAAGGIIVAPPDGPDVSLEPATATIDPRAIAAHVEEVAVRYGISPRLVAAIIEVESEFNARAISRKGARGLMQLMPVTVSELRVRDSFDPFQNITGGIRHLRRLMDRFDGNLPLVLAAYNAGEQAVLAYGGVPPYRETRRYVARVLRKVGRDPVTEGGRRNVP